MSHKHNVASLFALKNSKFSFSYFLGLFIKVVDPIGVETRAGTCLEWRASQGTDNYVVQGLVEQNMFGYADHTTERLKGNFVALSMQKFASNVVEKILHNASIGKARDIINEIVDDPNVLELFEDFYGNFVIQKALTTTAKMHESATDQRWNYYPSASKGKRKEVLGDYL
ncbi:hypothetical protein Syun_004223 [Stephania yunnanensis]|uniref:PUM-HD domain-containing protein n=1 Tax=Stephania yunnanensis TaxID=152371 RepID=A0AAP0L2X7_9MAGN